MYDVAESVLGTCDNFEEKGLGDERFNFFTGCPKAKTATIILRYGHTLCMYVCKMDSTTYVDRIPLFF